MCLIFRDAGASLGKTNSYINVIYYLIRRKKMTWDDRDMFYLCPSDEIIFYKDMHKIQTYPLSRPLPVDIKQKMRNFYVAVIIFYNAAFSIPRGEHQL